MAPQLVLIHGRGQAGKNPEELRRNWVAGLNKGLTLADRSTIATDSVAFLYYGDLIKHEIEALATRGLDDQEFRDALAQTDGMVPGPAATADEEVTQLQVELLGQIGDRAGRPLPDDRAEATRGVLSGIGKLQALQDVLEWVSDAAPWMGERLIYLVTRDVSLYLTKEWVRDAVQTSLLEQVREKVSASEPVVLVTHSLGTVVGLDFATEWATDYDIPVMVTCGSPLGIAQIYSRLKRQPQPECPDGIEHWYNAYDPRDVVALEEQLAPLFKGRLTDIKVQNGDQPHAIDRYLGHAEVARHIGVALS